MVSRNVWAVVSCFMFVQIGRCLAADYTQHNYYTEMLAFNRAELVTAYSDSGRHDVKWDLAASAALETLAMYDAQNCTDDVSGEGLYPDARVKDADLQQAAQKAIDLGCVDPMVLYARALAPINQGNTREGRLWLTRAEANLRAASYSPFRQLRVINRLRRICDDEEKRDVLWRTGLDLCEQVARGKFLNSAAHRESAKAIAFSMDSEVAAKSERAVNRFTSTPAADPWLVPMVTAYVESAIALEIAGKTADEFDSAYQKSMGVAGTAAEKAYRLNPAFPESATIMIGAAGPALAMKWLDRAREAQSDYHPAYAAFFRSMQWSGGNSAQCMDVAHQTADSKRFDTMIPAEYIAAVSASAGSTDLTKSPFKDQQVRQTAAEILNKYIAQTTQPAALEYFRTCLVAMDYLNNQKPEARNTLDTISGEPSVKAFRLFNLSTSLVIDDVYLSTMPDTADVAGFHRAMSRRVFRNADKFLQAVIDKDHPTGKAAEVITRLKDGTEMMMAFNKNGAVSLLDEKARGTWESEAQYKISDGTITALSSEPISLRSRYLFEDRHYTIHCEMEFDDISATRGQVFSLGWGIQRDLAVNVGWSLVLIPDSQSVLAQAPVSATSDVDKKYSTAVPAKNTIDITYWDDLCKVKVNGEEIDMDFGNIDVVKGFKPPNRLYLGTNASVKITRFTIKHLQTKP
jgi:hypothetical protein